MFVTIELDVAARVLAEKDPVAVLDLEWPDLAVIQNLSGPHRDDYSLLGFLFRRVWNDEPTGRLLLRAYTLDENPIVKWLIVICAVSW